jgi:hypothetical protein
VFCKDLWKLLLSAQSSPQGVPKELLEAKKLELIQEKVCQPPILYSSISNGICFRLRPTALQKLLSRDETTGIAATVK